MVERRIRDRKVSGSSSSRSFGEFVSTCSAFCADLVRYPFQPRVIAVARKRSRSFGEFFSTGSAFCADLFWYPFHPRVIAVPRKKSRSLSQKCKWQVTAKHTYTIRMWLLIK